MKENLKEKLNVTINLDIDNDEEFSQDQKTLIDIKAKEFIADLSGSFGKKLKYNVSVNTNN